MNDQEKRIEAANALDFLRCHPAVASDSVGDSMFGGFWFYMAECCKHGVSKDAAGVTIHVYPDDKDAERFADQFAKEHGEDWRIKEYEHMYDIDVPYEEYYGEPWVFDHVEYWYETTFFVFIGNPYDNLAEYDRKNWQGCVGPEGGANTWEDMIIDCAKSIKEAFGDFDNCDSFLTDAEKHNHEKENVCFFVDCGRDGLKSMKWNKNYIRIDEGLINLRWLKWFMATDYAKEHWEDNFKEWETFVAKIDKLEPKERKDILSAYTNS